MAFTRIRAFVHSRRLAHQIRSARRRELAALARAGEALAATEDLTVAFGRPALGTEIATRRREEAALTHRISDSLAADRADFALVSSWMQPLVVGRGLCARAVLRHQRGRVRRHLRPLYSELGSAAMAASTRDPGRTRVSAEIAEIVRRAQAEQDCGAAERAASLALAGGRALPAVVGALPRESVAFTVAFAQQLKSAIFPRVPALAGLAVGWWITRTYTDSRWKSLIRSVGIGEGGTRVVSSDTLQAMNFWLPILAAAICAYVGDRIARAYRRHYQETRPETRAPAGG